MRQEISMTKLVDTFEDALSQEFDAMRIMTLKATKTRLAARVDCLRQTARKFGLACTCSKTKEAIARSRPKGSMLPPSCKCRPMTALERSRRGRR